MTNIMKKVALFISPAENQLGYYLVVVSGEGFIESVGATVGAQIRGDDPWFDDRLLSIGDTGIARVGGKLASSRMYISNSIG